MTIFSDFFLTRQGIKVVSFIRCLFTNSVFLVQVFSLILFFSLVSFSPSDLSSANTATLKTMPLTFKHSHYRLTLQSKSFSQGELVFIKLESFSDYIVSVSISAGERQKQLFVGRKILSSQSDLDVYAIPAELPASSHQIVVTYLDVRSDTLVVSSRHSFQSQISQFPTMWGDPKILVKFQRAQPHHKARMQQENELMESIMRLHTPRKWQTPFLHPLPGAKISYPFYMRRLYNGKPGQAHSGLDFAARTGTPVYAINSGRILLARYLYNQGNTVILDHGQGLFSSYFHLHSLAVKEGNLVPAGGTIGSVGQTGLAALGPHLHLGIRLGDQPISPMSVIAMPEDL